MRPFHDARDFFLVATESAYITCCLLPTPPDLKEREGIAILFCHFILSCISPTCEKTFFSSDSILSSHLNFGLPLDLVPSTTSNIACRVIWLVFLQVACSSQLKCVLRNLSLLAPTRLSPL